MPQPTAYLHYRVSPTMKLLSQFNKCVSVDFIEVQLD
jgi:hypothetical protein